jgi:hypothetical protein
MVDRTSSMDDSLMPGSLHYPTFANLGRDLHSRFGGLKRVACESVPRETPLLRPGSGVDKVGAGSPGEP